MTELNSEFDRIMINKDNKAKNDKETYEAQLDEIIKSIDNKEQEHNENIKQLTDEKMKYFNENQNLQVQLENIKAQITSTSIQEKDEKDKMKNNYELKLSEVFNMNNELADKVSILNDNIKKLNDELNNLRNDTTKNDEIKAIQAQLMALKSEYELLQIASNEKKALFNKQKED